MIFISFFPSFKKRSDPPDGMVHFLDEYFALDAFFHTENKAQGLQKPQKTTAIFKASNRPCVLSLLLLLQG